MRFFHTALLLSLLVASAAQARQPRQQRDEVGQFDYYAVSMSWSPSYCATHKDPAQCARGRQLGFVLHGLWPQHEVGYPENCSTEPLPDAVRTQYATMFPSPTLVAHEWKAHGSCSGLTPEAYFALTSRLKEQLTIPAPYRRPEQPLRLTIAGLAKEFKDANPALAPNSVLPFCDGGGRFLREIHACYDKSRRSRSCSEGEIKRSANSCRQADFLLQSVR